MAKRYYWLKLKEDFFGSKQIKKLRRMAGGDTYTIIYLKMQLTCLKTGGVIEYTGLEKDFVEELALDLDENPDDVRMTLAFLSGCKLIETSDGINYFLPQVLENTGSEADSTQRVREYRANSQLPVPKREPKTNAERQSAYRAKAVCEKSGHVPYIEDYANRKRYNGNYYICFRRDKCRCAICGDNENLCMHHIDGYDENKPGNSDENKMVTLCRECHSKVHAGERIPEEILESIGYYDSNESNVTCNTEIEKETREEIDKDKEKKTNKRHAAAKDTSYIDEMFERVWKMYPKKEGKHRVSKESKRKLYDAGEDTIVKAIENYKSKIEKDKTVDKYIKHGSTFFNGDWQDFVGEPEQEIPEGYVLDKYGELMKMPIGRLLTPEECERLGRDY